MIRKTLIQLAAAAALLAVLLGAYGAWFYAVSQQSAQMNLLAGQIQTSAADTQRVAAAKMALQQLSASEASVNQHLVSTSDVVPFLESLQATGTSFGAKVQVESVSANPAAGSHGTLQLQLQVTGSFDSVMRTLGSLEYSSYGMQLTDLSLAEESASGKGARQWQAGAAFTVGTASDVPSKPTGSATSTAPVQASAPANPAVPATPPSAAAPSTNAPASTGIAPIQ